MSLKVIGAGPLWAGMKTLCIALEELMSESFRVSLPVMCMACLLSPWKRERSPPRRVLLFPAGESMVGTRTVSYETRFRSRAI